MIEKIKNEIILYSKLAYQRHLVGAAGGNISAKCEEYFLITAGGKSLRDVTEKDILVLNDKCQIVGKDIGLKPSKETALHLSIYKNREDIDCIIHVHPGYCTAFSIKKIPVPLYTASAKLKLKEVPIIGYAEPGSSELASLVEECVKNCGQHIKALTMEAHGLLVWDKGLGSCFDIAELVEETAKVAYLSDNIKKMNTCD